MQTVYGLICDGGDGSAHVEWYRNTPENVLKEKTLTEWECYGLNEGSIIRINFPENFDLASSGLSFSD